MPNKTKNEIAWEKLEAKLHFINYIENNQQFIISADQIKNIGKREPRLMAKFDHHRNLPGLFKHNELGIVPISGSEYYLSKFNPFKDLSYSEGFNYIDPGNIERYQTIELGNIRSEDKAIIIANISNILKEFTNEEDLRLTTKGKFGVGSFTFNLETAFGNKQVAVKGGGAELDAGFEGEKFYVFEAKMGKVSDFNIRQLYYPFRFWKGKIKKEVVPVFFTYSDKVFSLWELKFNDVNNYHSIDLVKHLQFAFYDETKITEDLLNITEFKKSDPDSVPFPQADDFEKVIDILDLVNVGINKKEKFVQYFDFDKRQADYYFNAAKYLDLVYIKKGFIFLTELGNEIANLKRKQRHGYLIREILSRKVFFDTYLKIKGGEKVEKEQVVEIMKKNNVLEGNTTKMFERRAQTIISWCKWIDRKFRDEKTS